MNKRIRHHRTTAEYKRVLEAVLNDSSRSQSAICLEFGIPESSFRHWRYRQEGGSRLTTTSHHGQNNRLSAHQESQTGVEFAQNLINFAKSYQLLVERNVALANQLAQCQNKLQTLDEIMRRPS